MPAVAALYFALIVLGFAVVLILAVHTLRSWQYPGAWAFCGYLMCALIVIGSFILLLNSHTPEQGFFWARMRFVGFGFAAPVFLLFVLTYTERRVARRLLLLTALFCIPVLTQFVLWTDAVIPLFYTEWSLRQFSFLSVEYSRFGAWFQIFALNIYVQLVVSYYLLTTSLAIVRGAQRQLIVWVLTGSAVVLVAGILPLVFGNTLPLNPTPLGFSLGMILCGWAVLRHRLFDLSAVAYHTIFRNFQDAILIIDADDKIVDWNPTARAWFTAPLKAQPVSRFLAAQGFVGALPAADDAEFELVGAERVFAARATTLRLSNGFAAGRMLVLRDITARKWIERDLEEFAYVVSHDLRAPLRGISSIAQWLTERYGAQLPDDGKEIIMLLDGRARRMEQMINGVLEYSRLGRDAETYSAVDLHALVAQITQDIVPADRIAVSFDNPLPTLSVDATRIRQVFQNLIDNAVKFMDKPIGEIHIGCVEEAEAWRFWVRDNGPGIAADQFERIFQLFQTLNPKDRLESTGIGLALSKRIVELYGGRIWVESVEKNGTTFYFTLPRQQRDA